MRTILTTLHLFIVFCAIICDISGQIRLGNRNKGAARKTKYTVAFASFAPLNTDIFVADADGRNPQPLLSPPALDYNASFSRDGQWIVFTSERRGSADIYRAHPDGPGLQSLVAGPSFDDQAALSTDGKSPRFCLRSRRSC